MFLFPKIMFPCSFRISATSARRRNEAFGIVLRVENPSEIIFQRKPCIFHMNISLPQDMPEIHQLYPISMGLYPHVVVNFLVFLSKSIAILHFAEIESLN